MLPKNVNMERSGLVHPVMMVPMYSTIPYEMAPMRNADRSRSDANEATVKSGFSLKEAQEAQESMNAAESLMDSVENKVE